MEFMFPIQYTGVGYKRVTADNLAEAIEKAKHEAEITARFDIKLSDVQHEVLAPVLMLTDEEKLTWPYWEYGFTGVDGSDWRIHYTRDGLASIPDYAETKSPVTKDWLPSWRQEK